MELLNMDPDVVEELYKVASINLSPNSPGQVRLYPSSDYLPFLLDNLFVFFTFSYLDSLLLFLVIHFLKPCDNPNPFTAPYQPILSTGCCWFDGEPS